MPVSFSRNQLVAAVGAAAMLLAAGVYLGRVSNGPAESAGEAAVPANSAAAQSTATPSAALTWVRPGLRLTYHAATATKMGTHTQMVPDENGDWKYVDTGGPARPDAAGAGSGQGYLQVTVADISDGTAALEVRNYLLAGPGTFAAPLLTGQTVAVENAPDFWRDPVTLAALKDEKSDGLRIERYSPTINGRTYRAIAIHTRTGNGATSYTYDLETGLLLIGGLNTWNNNSTSMNQWRLQSARQLNLPWAGMAAPDALRGTRAIAFSGTATTVQAGYPVTQAASGACTLGRTGPGWAQCSYRDNMTPATLDRVYGTTQTLGLWIPPAALDSLAPGVLDEDPVTRARFSYVGVRGGHAVFTEKVPGIETEVAYDPVTGMLRSRSDVYTSGLAPLTVTWAVAQR